MKQSIEKDKVYIFGLICLMILFTDFFQFHPLLEFFNKVRMIIILPLFYFCYRPFIEEKGGFSFPLRLIIFSILFSFVTVYYSWHQSLWATFNSITFYLGFIVYFYLIRTEISIEKIEKTMLFFSLLYVILYFFQFLNPDTVFFGAWSQLYTVRGITRIIFAGEGFLFFAICYYTCKVFNNEFWKIRDALYLSVLLIVMFMQVTRQYIMAVGIVILLQILRKSKIYIKIFAIVAVIMAFNIYQYSSNPMISGLRNAQESDMELAEDYIRVLAANYFLFEMAPNTLSTIFGNGVPGFGSTYGDFYNNEVIDDFGFYFVDVGMIGGYAIFGILFVIGYLLIGYKTYRLKGDDDSLYLKYYILIIFIMSLTSSSVIGSGYILPTGIVLYLLYKKSEEIKYEEEIEYENGEISGHD